MVAQQPIGCVHTQSNPQIIPVKRPFPGELYSYPASVRKKAEREGRPLHLPPPAPLLTPIRVSFKRRHAVIYCVVVIALWILGASMPAGY